MLTAPVMRRTRGRVGNREEPVHEYMGGSYRIAWIQRACRLEERLGDR